MAELRSPDRAAAAADYLPLARAAALAHERLFPGQGAKDSKTLDLLAVGLSALIPFYQRDVESGELHEVAKREIEAGRFTRGATTLEFANRPPLRYLVVSRRQLYAALGTLAKDSPLAARLGAARRQPPRPPA